MFVIKFIPTIYQKCICFKFKLYEYTIYRLIEAFVCLLFISPYSDTSGTYFTF